MERTEKIQGNNSKKWDYKRKAHYENGTIKLIRSNIRNRAGLLELGDSRNSHSFESFIVYQLVEKLI